MTAPVLTTRAKYTAAGAGVGVGLGLLQVVADSPEVLGPLPLWAQALITALVPGVIGWLSAYRRTPVEPPADDPGAAS